eukprot:COSAG02_NODE_513_length_20826_cov_323.015246_19_plen_94_part_00
MELTEDDEPIHNLQTEMKECHSSYTVFALRVVLSASVCHGQHFGTDIFADRSKLPRPVRQAVEFPGIGCSAARAFLDVQYTLDLIDPAAQIAI